MQFNGRFTADLSGAGEKLPPILGGVVHIFAAVALAGSGIMCCSSLQ